MDLHWLNDDWGALRAWAWGASRALDYFETDRSVDARQVGVEGHSRYGKATLVTMAFDQRFVVAYVSSSGEGGAKLYRRNWGETGPVYKLLGKRDMGTGEFPAFETPIVDGDVAFRQHSGGHTPGPNWPTFLTFAERYLKGR